MLRMRKIIQAARVANAHNFIINFPDGYDTMLDEMAITYPAANGKGLQLLERTE